MQIVMSVIFLIWTVIAAQSIHNVAAAVRHDYVPGADRHMWKVMWTFVSLAFMCVHYLSWIMGIILFLLIFFGMIHYCFGWVLVIPRLLDPVNRMEKAIYNDLRFSIVTAILSFGILIASVWYVDSGFLQDVVSNNLWIIAVFIGAMILGAILNYVVRLFIIASYP